MSDLAALLEFGEPGGLTARWNFPAAIGSPAAAPGGLGTGALVTYSFVAALPAYETAAEHPGFQPFDATLRAAATDALAAWAAVCNLGFAEVPDAGEGGDIRLGRSDMAAGGYAWFPAFGVSVDAAGAIVAATPLPRGGDIWLDTDPTLEAQGPGEYGRYALVHEIGHAIGLKHPFEGATTLPAAEADTAHTVMGYAVPANFTVVTVTGGPEAYGWTVSGLYPSTPMPADIAAAQVLYGTNRATNAGDTTYAWSPGERLLETIWDGGGIDTLDAGNQALPCIIDLVAGHASSIGLRLTEAARRAELPDWATAAPTPGYDGRDNLWIAAGVTLENAVGGAGDDLLIGNAADNLLAGGAGWDTAVLPGPQAGTVLAATDGAWEAIGPGGHDLLRGIEAVRFDDGTVVLPAVLIG